MDALDKLYCSNINATCHTGGFFAPSKKTAWKQPYTHTFVQNKFYFITKGSCIITIDGTTYETCAGEWFFIPSGTPHSYSKKEDTTFEKYWMHFDFFPNSDLFRLASLPYMVKVPENHYVYLLFDRFSKLISKKTQFSERLTIKAILFELVAEYIKLAKPDGISIKKMNDERLDKIFRYIDNNISKVITVNELSELCYMHPNHLIRYFKDKTGFTPAKYISEKKMERAKSLLESTTLPVNEIMLEIGMEDAGYFSKSFKSAYAMSPRSYRTFYKSNLVNEGIVKQ